jgi:mono/diheme cytochrome c family protein
MFDGVWRAAALALVFLVAGAGMAEQDPDTARGQELFQHYCSSCHGGNGSGNGPVAPALSTPPADLRRIAARRGGSFPADEVAAHIDGRRDVVAHGTREMPVWGRVLGEKFRRRQAPETAVAVEIRLLTEYLQSIQLPRQSREPEP